MTISEPVRCAEQANDTKAPEPVVRALVPPPAISALTGIRALACIWVIINHFEGILAGMLPFTRDLRPPIRAGYLSVEVFFLLSGFILAYNYGRKLNSKAALNKYLWARLARIYPVYLVTFLMAFAFAMVFPETLKEALGPDFPFTASNLVANVFVMHALPGFTGYDGPSWSVSCEVVAYLAFPMLAWWVIKLSSRAALAWAAAVLATGIVLINLTTAASPSWSVEHHVMWLRISTDFTAGVLLWAWWRGRKRGSARWDLVAVACVAATVLLSFVIDPDDPVSFVFLPLVALFVLSCASATGSLGRFLSSSPMQWGGKVSYSLFLGHFPVLLMMRQFLPWEGFFDAPLPVRLGYLLVAGLWIVGTGAVLYHFVEEPVRRVILRRWARRQAARATA